MEKADAADAAHAQFKDESSDFLTYLKLWKFYHSAARKLSTNKLRKLCHQNFLSFVRMREWHDIHQQLHALVTEMGLHRNPRTTPSPSRPPRSHLLNRQRPDSPKM